jgi:hypothetical protein
MRTRWMLSGGCMAAVLAASLGAAADPTTGAAAAILEEGRAKQKVARYDEAAELNLVARAVPRRSLRPTGYAYPPKSLVFLGRDDDVVVVRLDEGRSAAALLRMSASPP